MYPIWIRIHNPAHVTWEVRVTISRHLFVPLSPEVTIRPKASQGEVNWAMGAEAAIAPSQRCGNLIRSQAASMPEERKVPVLG